MCDFRYSSSNTRSDATTIFFRRAIGRGSDFTLLHKYKCVRETSVERELAFSVDIHAQEEKSNVFLAFHRCHLISDRIERVLSDSLRSHRQEEKKKEGEEGGRGRKKADNDSVVNSAFVLFIAVRKSARGIRK